jgi:transcriptional repressor NrdR
VRTPLHEPRARGGRAPVVVKKDGVREPFDREKCCGVCASRATSARWRSNRIEQFIDELERQLIESEAKEVDSKQIGERVMKLLRELDEVAYVRFASVYRSFRDIDEFRSELDKMARARRSEAAAESPSGEAQR